MKPVQTFLIIVVLLSMGACTMQEGMFGDDIHGALQLSLEYNPRAKTLVPSLSMEPTAFVVSGDGPDGETFSETITDSSLFLQDLVLGPWTITVQALNNDSTVIASGSDSTIIQAGQVAVVNITVTPLDGVGTLDLSLSWPGNETIDPSIESKLLPPVGSEINLPFTITDGNLGTYNNDDLNTGYYTAIIKLLDLGSWVYDVVEVVRIVKDQVTSGVFTLTEINPNGTIEINITPEMNEIIDVTINGGIAELPKGDAMSVSAVVPPDVGNVVYVWYLKGDPVSTNQSDSFGNDLDKGVYNLTVTAFTADGARAGSATHPFHVVDPNVK